MQIYNSKYVLSGCFYYYYIRVPVTEAFINSKFTKMVKTVDKQRFSLAFSKATVGSGSKLSSLFYIYLQYKVISKLFNSMILNFELYSNHDKVVSFKLQNLLISMERLDTYNYNFITILHLRLGEVREIVRGYLHREKSYSFLFERHRTHGVVRPASIIIFHRNCILSYVNTI